MHRSKDTISPAQAVIMRLLTHIYRARQAQADTEKYLDLPTIYPTRADAIMVKCLLLEFRRHIIPQTCALVFLQGQIRSGNAPAEDFPLNMYDVERMYEGILQYLEFFRVLTQFDTWRQMLAEWDIVSELVTLLKELDAAIPKSLLAREMAKLPANLARQHERARNGPPLPQDITSSTQPVSIERPYDVGQAGNTGPGMPESTLSFHQPTSAPMINGGTGATPEIEPSEFEWKNVKRVTVQVLSNMAFSFPKVQDQVREHGGIEALHNCTRHDDFNPYIREDAVPAIRYLVEGNEKNREVVRDLEARFPRYDVKAAARIAASTGAAVKGQQRAVGKKGSRGATFIEDPMTPVPGKDYDGEVHGKRTTATVRATPAGAVHEQTEDRGHQDGAPAGPSPPSAGLFDLMQQVMKEMPARVGAGKGVIDREKEELLRQLDQEFD